MDYIDSKKFLFSAQTLGGGFGSQHFNRNSLVGVTNLPPIETRLNHSLWVVGRLCGGSHPGSGYGNFIRLEREDAPNKRSFAGVWLLDVEMGINRRSVTREKTQVRSTQLLAPIKTRPVWSFMWSNRVPVRVRAHARLLGLPLAGYLGLGCSQEGGGGGGARFAGASHIHRLVGTGDFINKRGLMIAPSLTPSEADFVLILGVADKEVRNIRADELTKGVYWGHERGVVRNSEEGRERLFSLLKISPAYTAPTTPAAPFHSAGVGNEPADGVIPKPVASDLLSTPKPGEAHELIDGDLSRTHSLSRAGSPG